MKGDDSLGPKLKQKILFCLVYRFWTNEWICVQGVQTTISMSWESLQGIKVKTALNC